MVLGSIPVRYFQIPQVLLLIDIPVEGEVQVFILFQVFIEGAQFFFFMEEGEVDHVLPDQAFQVFDLAERLIVLVLPLLAKITHLVSRQVLIVGHHLAALSPVRGQGIDKAGDMEVSYPLHDIAVGRPVYNLGMDTGPGHRIIEHDSVHQYDRVV